MAEAPGFDAEALQRKYRDERAKRIRRDGLGQYRHLTDEEARDPYVEPGFSRPPVSKAVDVLILGGGFGGLLAGARLRQAGVNDLCLVENGGDFGGTWYWNRYPGAACDVESYIYMPLLEELNYVPSEKYAKAPEIAAHARAIGRHFDLYKAALFQTRVTGMAWEDAQARWVVTTDRGDELRARFVCASTGLLSVPKLAEIPGVERFRGRAFHTSRWDYGYTGGDDHGNLTGLADKRVGIIGTGATGLQAVPHLGRSARQLYVFQRTPASVDLRGNRPTDPDWARNLAPGWQKRRRDNFNNLVSGLDEPEDLVSDGWTNIMRHLGPGLAAERRQMADFRKMEEVRARVDALVKDPATAAALKPYYNQLCKRPGFHDEYLQTFNLPNVTLVDTDGRGVEAITETAVIANGQAYEVDCLIFATGFEWVTNFDGRDNFEVTGRGGRTRSEAWKDGVVSLHGFMTRDFPNYFTMCSSQSGVAVNFTHIADEMSQHIAHIVKHCLDEGVGEIEPTEEAQRAWVESCVNLANMRRTFHTECTPGYYNDEGAPSLKMARNSFWGGPSPTFIRMLAEWREAGDMPGLETRAAKGAGDLADQA